MKTIVSKDLCVGCELCPGIAPALYKMDDDGLAVAVTRALKPDEEALAKEAVSSCPVDAISVN